MSMSNRHRNNEHKEAVVNSSAQRHSGVLAGAVAAILLYSGTPAIVSAAGFEEARTFTIRSQSLTSALMEFAEQSNIQVITSADELKQFDTPGVQGNVSIEEALRRLLKGTGLSYRKVGEGTVTIVPVRRTRDESSAMQPVSFERPETQKRVAQASISVSNDNEGVADERKQDDVATREVLSEVIVTGSRINRVDHSVPLTTITREQIDAMGITTAEELLRRIPQNLSNVSQNTMGGTAGGAMSYQTFDGTGVNLRGVGSSATLVLVNGRRTIAAGNGSFTDVALIPFSAIERVEILADGASAIYGSDAVGGVINFILKKEYDVRETGASYGLATRGGAEKLTLSQSLASGWDRGGARVHVEYTDSERVGTYERDFIDKNNSWFVGGDLVPANDKLIATSGAEHQLTDELGLVAEAMYARRNSQSYTEFSNARVDRHTTVEQYGVMAELDYRLSSAWSVKLRPQYNTNTSRDRQTRTDVVGPIDLYGNKLTTTSLDIDVTRAVTASGIGFVAGGQVRREGFEERSPFYPSDVERDLTALYGELRLPLAKAAADSVGRVELSLAGRYEDYEYAGSAISPKVGLSWQATRGLNVRSTWGTSFKAPLLTETNLSDVTGFIIKDRYETADGRLVSALTISGSNAALEPERSKNLTVGFDWLSEDLRGGISATYFDIRYEDRIMAPNTYLFADTGQELLAPALASLITLDPAQTQVDSLIGSMRFLSCYDIDYVGCDPAEVVGDVKAIIDTRLRNFAATRTRGIDVEGNKSFSLGAGAVDLTFAGTYYLEQEERLFENSSTVQSLLNQVYGTIDFRARAGATYRLGQFAGSVLVNYTDDYADSRGFEAVGSIPIDSLTTVDITAAYDFSAGASLMGLQRLRLSFSAQNVFDESPPWLLTSNGVHYDGVNGDVLGRFVSLSVTGAW